MPAVYTYSEARQRLATLLEQAIRDGEVRVKRQDGRIFVIRPVPRSKSPLDVEGVDMDLVAEEIVAFIHEGRRE